MASATRARDGLGPPANPPTVSAPRQKLYVATSRANPLAVPAIRRATHGFVIVPRASEADFMIFDLDHPPKDWANYLTNPCGLTSEIRHCFVLNVDSRRKNKVIEDQLDEVFAARKHIYHTAHALTKDLQYELTIAKPPVTATELALAISRSGSAPRKKVFISYSHHDRSWVERLRTMCAPMFGKVDLWDDTRIKPSQDWRAEIERAIEAAGFAVLLVTPEFLKSDFITTHELPRLLDAARSEREMKVLWIAVEHSMVHLTPIHRYQALNEPDRPLADCDPGKLEFELLQIANRIHEACVDWGGANLWDIST
jgi:hypothetical protein